MRIILCKLDVICIYIYICSPKSLVGIAHDAHEIRAPAVEGQVLKLPRHVLGVDYVILQYYVISDYSIVDGTISDDIMLYDIILYCIVMYYNIIVLHYITLLCACSSLLDTAHGLSSMACC